ETELAFPLSRFPFPANVYEDLRAGAARSGFPHLPEIVLVAQTIDPLVGEARHLPPEPARFVVRVMHRDVDAAGGNAQPVLPGHPGPGVFDRLLLEIVAEGEVAEHLEEGVMAGRMADLLEVVVFAARPHALLASHRPGIWPSLEPLKDALELHHPGVREQERGVVGRDQGGAGHFLVLPALEEVKK